MHISHRMSAVRQASAHFTFNVRCAFERPCKERWSLWDAIGEDKCARHAIASRASELNRNHRRQPQMGGGARVTRGGSLEKCAGHRWPRARQTRPKSNHGSNRFSRCEPSGVVERRLPFSRWLASSTMDAYALLSTERRGLPAPLTIDEFAPGGVSIHALFTGSARGRMSEHPDPPVERPGGRLKRRACAHLTTPISPHASQRFGALRNLPHARRGDCDSAFQVWDSICESSSLFSTPSCNSGSQPMPPLDREDGRSILCAALETKGASAFW